VCCVSSVTESLKSQFIWAATAAKIIFFLMLQNHSKTHTVPQLCKNIIPLKVVSTVPHFKHFPVTYIIIIPMSLNDCEVHHLCLSVFTLSSPRTVEIINSTLYFIKCHHLGQFTQTRVRSVQLSSVAIRPIYTYIREVRTSART
jgi:hypothetical protein